MIEAESLLLNKSSNSWYANIRQIKANKRLEITQESIGSTPADRKGTAIIPGAKKASENPN
jgi:hypothetical protein